MSYPRKYPTTDGTALAPLDWNVMVDRVNGVADEGIFQYPFSFIVRINGGYYEAINGNGQLIYGGLGNAGGATGTNAAEVIQAALDGLTAGRTWKEKVVLKGEFILPTTPSIPNYTTLDLRDAYLKGSMTSPNYVLGNGVNGESIDILGGVVDGDNICGHALAFATGTKNSRILGTEVKQAGDHNIVLNGCINCEVDAYSHHAGKDGIAIVDGSIGCRINGEYDDNGAYGMLVLASTDNIIKGKYCNNYAYGIRLNKGANNNIFDHPIVDGVIWDSGRGIMLDASDTGLGAGGNSGNIFIAPTVKNCLDRGIWVYSIDGYPNSENIFLVPRVELNGAHGIDLSTFSKYNVIRGGVIKNNNGVGVFITGTGNKAIGVHSFDDRTPKQQTHGIYVNSDDYHQIEENNVEGNLVANMVIAGTVTTKVRGNIGFVTENSGTATGTSPITKAHGLVGTPTSVTLGASGATALKTSWTADADNIYIYHDGGSSTITWYAEYRP